MLPPRNAHLRTANPCLHSAQTIGASYRGDSPIQIRSCEEVSPRDFFSSGAARNPDAIHIAVRKILSRDQFQRDRYAKGETADGRGITRPSSSSCEGGRPRRPSLPPSRSSLPTNAPLLVTTLVIAGLSRVSALQRARGERERGAYVADADLAAAAAAAAISPPSMYDILVSSLASRTHTKRSPQKRNRGTLATPTGMSRNSEFKCLM